MEDPETGKLLEVAPEVAKAMTRDYSQLMKAINNKKGYVMAYQIPAGIN
jgi:hypothetical protein